MATLRLAIYLMIGALVVQAVLSWINPYSPYAQPVSQFTRPLLAPLQRFIPPLGMIDLSPLIAILLIACPLLPFIIMAICKGDRLPSRSRGAAWVCGYDHEKSMVITAHGFAMPVKQAFAPVLKLRKWLNPVSLVPGWQCEGSALLFRRMALVELAVLVVIIVSRGA